MSTMLFECGKCRLLVLHVLMKMHFEDLPVLVFLCIIFIFMHCKIYTMWSNWPPNLSLHGHKCLRKSNTCRTCYKIEFLRNRKWNAPEWANAIRNYTNQELIKSIGPSYTLHQTLRFQWSCVRIFECMKWRNKRKMGKNVSKKSKKMRVSCEEGLSKKATEQIDQNTVTHSR